MGGSRCYAPHKRRTKPTDGSHASATLRHLDLWLSIFQAIWLLAYNFRWIVYSVCAVALHFTLPAFSYIPRMLFFCFREREYSFVHSRVFPILCLLFIFLMGFGGVCGLRLRRSKNIIRDNRVTCDGGERRFS